MALSNAERVGKALELLNAGLRPFVERELQAAYGKDWVAQAGLLDPRAPVNKKSKEARMDAHALLGVMWDQWNDVFKKTLGQAERSLVSELRDVRNKWAHQEAFSTDDAYRALDSIQRLLNAVSAPETAEVDRQKREILRVRFDEQARQEKRRSATASVEGQPSGGLKPWREIITPHPDVASGRYQQAEFAGTRLRLELDRIPLWDGDHASLKQLASYFAKYLYLPRLRDSDVLLAAIRDGLRLLTWRQETFAYADAWDAHQKRYRGLKVGNVGGISLSGDAVLLKPEVAAKQMEADHMSAASTTSQRTTPAGMTEPIASGAAGSSAPMLPLSGPTELKLSRFHGSAHLDPTRLTRDAGKIAEEVVQHLSGLVGATVSVTLEIHADVPDGVPENIVRTVTENGRTLRFKTQGFEEK